MHFISFIPKIDIVLAKCDRGNTVTLLFRIINEYDSYGFVISYFSISSLSISLFLSFNFFI